MAPRSLSFISVSFVISLTRLAVSLAIALGGAVALVPAQSTPAQPANSSLPADLAAFLAALPKWSTSVAVKAAYGYKDNLLLSFADEERSAFARGGVEVLLLRVPQGPFEYSFYADVEATHYFSATTYDHDAKVWLRTEPGYRVGETLKISLPVTGYYYDQVYDVSDTDLERQIAALKVHGGMIAPTVR